MAVTSMANSSIRDFQKFRNMAAQFGVPPFACEYVVVAGGGSGGRTGGRGAGGGGAGGYRSNVSGENTGGGLSAEPALSLVAGTYAVTVGAGGAAQSSSGEGFPGVNSVFDNVTSIGGGPGEFTTRTAGGGSGGGGGGNSGTGIGAPGTTGQGFKGGNAFVSNDTANAGAGGGGASAAGTNASSGVATNGGNGVASLITGTSVTRAGGGGGSVSVGTRGLGGSGGGGNGGSQTPSLAPAAGDANTGGGGGADSAGTSSGAGGSGVVIFSVPAQAIVTFSVGVTHSVAKVGVNNVYTVTATSTTDETVTIG